MSDNHNAMLNNQIDSENGLQNFQVDQNIYNVNENDLI